MMLVVYIVKATISEELMLVPFFLVEEVCSNYKTMIVLLFLIMAVNFSRR